MIIPADDELLLFLTEDVGVEVKSAPDRTLIATSFYDTVASGQAAYAEAGEGWFVIHATNGTFRYRLTGEIEGHGPSSAYVMRRHQGG